MIEFDTELAKFTGELVQILASSNHFNFDRCVVAHYLGSLRSNEACAVLSSNIGLRYNPNEAAMLKVMLLDPFPAQRALIQIGHPSINSLIKNLESVDDSEVRQLSIEALTLIDQDKDVTRLRLEKRLAAEPDAVTQERIRAALQIMEATALNRKQRRGVTKENSLSN